MQVSGGGDFDRTVTLRGGKTSEGNLRSRITGVVSTTLVTKGSGSRAHFLELPGRVRRSRLALLEVC